MSYTNLLEVYRLWNAGEAAYGVGLHRLASDYYRQAAELSQSLEGDVAWYKGVMVRSFADELTTLERLREALAVLSAVPKAAEEGFRACCVYGSMTDHIEIALRLPVGLGRIERACRQAEDYFRAAGETTWRSRVLYYRAELLYERGLYRGALAAAQEGASLASEGCPRLFPSSHMYGLFRISVALGDLAEARRYLDRWVEEYGKESKHNSVRGAYEHVMRSRLARARGDAEEAVDSSCEGARWLQSADWGDARFDITCEQVRAYLLAGRHEHAAGLLARLAPMRRSESGHRRYALALLRGDYHLARARAAAGLPTLDDEFGTSGVRVRRGPGARPVGSAVARARRAYEAAHGVGAWIDGLLECSVRTEEVARRLARLSDVSRVASEGVPAGVGPQAQFRRRGEEQA
jgi:tetratricopeptide (TPR) repeat protein